MEGRQRRSFTDDYKRQAVDLVASSGRSIGSVAKELGLRDSVLRRWVEQRGALLPIAPVVCRLTMRAIAVWFKDRPVGSPRQCADFVGQWREELLASIWTSGLTECHLWVEAV